MEIGPEVRRGMTVEESVILNLVRRVEELEKVVHKLATDTIVRKTELPVDLLQENGLLPREPKTTRSGVGSRPLMPGEVQEAIAKTSTMTAAAKAVGVCFSTFKKYARDYGQWRPTRGVGKVQP